MANKVLSIEIGEKTTKICELDFRRKNARVYHSISFETPQGAIEDGYIRDKIAFAKALRDALDNAEITNDRIVFSIASTKIANREAMIPFVQKNRIQDIIQANADSYFPVNVEEYILSYTVLERVSTKEAKQLRLMVIAAPSNLIKTYYELADLMRLNIVAIDYIGNSTYQLLRNQLSLGVNLVVEINEKNTIVNLFERNKLLIQRILPYGLIHLVDEVMSNSVFEANDYNVALKMLKEQKIIKHQFDVQSTGPALSNMSEEVSKQLMIEEAKEEVTSSLKYLVGNINRIMDYFGTKHQGKKIGSIYITGEGVRVQGLSKLFYNELGLETRVLDKLFGVSFAKVTSAEQAAQCDYISCVGAVIDPVNFVPKEYQLRKSTESSKSFAVIFLAASIGVSVLVCGLSYFSYRGALNEKNTLETNIAQIQDIEQIYNDYMKKQNDAKNMETLHSMTKTSTESFLDFLSELEGKMPSASVAVSLAVNNDAVVINATSSSLQEVAVFIQQLKTFNSLSSVSVTSTAEAVDENNISKVTYNITCAYAK